MDLENRQEGGVALSTETERAVAEIWQRLLGESVTRNDDFFALGGHSLLAAAMVQEVSERLLADVQPSAVLRTPTLSDFCAAVDALPRRATPNEPSSNTESAPTASRDRSSGDHLDASAFTPEAGDPCATQSGLPTHSQEALWFLDSGGQALSAYNIARAWRIYGRVDAAAMADALSALMDRHDALRTLFHTRDDRVETRVSEGLDPDYCIIDLSKTPVGRRDALMKEQLCDEAARGFEFAVGPLIRCRLFRLSEHLYVFLVVVHHIVADGWSMGVIEAELSTLYQRALAGKTAPMPTLPRAFSDYAHEQRARVQSPALEASTRFWQEHLAGIEPLPLPFDSPRGARQKGQAAHETVLLEPDLVTGLGRIAQERGATLYMVLLAGLQILLMRYCRVTDIAVGTPVAGRDLKVHETTVGYFANTVVLRSDLSGDPPFDTLLERVRNVTLDALAHQEVPFERLVALIQPHREPGVNPLFQVSLALQNAPSNGLSLDGLRVEREPVMAGAAKFDLALAFTDHEGSLVGELQYEPALFESGTIRRLGQHLRNLFSAVVQAPTKRLSALTLDDREERALLVRYGTGKAYPIPSTETLADLFEAWSADTPDAIAIRHGRQTTTYRELNGDANRIAHRLAQMGVTAGSKVAVALPRGKRFVTSVLAVIKLGAAYVPLDPQHPVQRLSAMLEDARPEALITGRHAPPTVNHLSEIRVVDLDADAAVFTDMPTANPDRSGTAEAGPESLAYLIYTSGSTGTPKAVMVPQRGILRLCLGADYASLTQQTNIGQASNVAFDAATFEIWGALLNGGQLTVVDHDTLLDPAALADLIATAGITTLFLTTALFNLHAAKAPATFNRLRDLLVGGEAADPQSMAQVLAGSPSARLVNIYGPTETTTFATFHEIGTDDGPRFLATRTGVPIGRPIVNTNCQVVDATMHPVPIGIVGELCIGGAGVALGYLDRPELNSERFVTLAGEANMSKNNDPNPANIRFYRTGDLVRWTADGLLQYLGRNDSQIKLRGFRIEPGEIEHRLRAVTGIRDAIVWVTEHPIAGRRLVAAVKREDPADSDVQVRARKSLAETMPDYMMPSQMLVLDTFPLTANGKIDRRAIDSLITTERAVDSSRIEPLHAPSNKREAAMTRLWREIIGVETVALNDDFFDLGGYSLLGVRLLAAVEREFGQSLPFSSIFETPTPRQMLQVLDTAEKGNTIDGRVIAVKASGSLSPLFFISGYGGLTVGLKTFADSLGPERPCYALDPGAFDPDELRTTPLAVTAEKLLAAMRSVQPQGPYHLAGFSLGGKYAYEIAQQLRAVGITVGLLCLLDCAGPDYPPPRPWTSRFVLYVAQLARTPLSGIPRRVAHHLRFRWRRLAGHQQRIFKDDADEMEALSLGAAMQSAAEATLAQWSDYSPQSYAGDLGLIVTEPRRRRIPEIDDDPLLGWQPLVEGHIVRRTIRCRHRDMIKPESATETGRLVSELLALKENDAFRLGG